jgi:formylglycine-generating enzyme required for sulfatase activity
MKQFSAMKVMAVLLCLALSGCPDPGGNEPLDQEIFAAEGVSFTMNLVSPATFPIGTDDTGTATVETPFYIAETEVTYQLWTTVYTWAVDESRGDEKYTFANTGTLGGAGTGSDQQPVTVVSWRDCIVWCNAVTEWYNAMTGTDFICIYRSLTGDILRNANDVASSTPEVGMGAGFRLPMRDEWELAARWQNDDVNTVLDYSHPWFTKGNSASGAIADVSDAEANGVVAVYSATGTEVVKSKGSAGANDLGLYDMSGNVWEWCFETVPSGARVLRGGGWNHTEGFLMIGYFGDASSNDRRTHWGFRIAKNVEL